MDAPGDMSVVIREIYTLGTLDRTAEAIAVRDGTVCSVADTYEVEFNEGYQSPDRVGRPRVVPGFLVGHSCHFRVG